MLCFMRSRLWRSRRGLEPILLFQSSIGISLGLVVGLVLPLPFKEKGHCAAGSKVPSDAPGAGSGGGGRTAADGSGNFAVAGYRC